MLVQPACPAPAGRARRERRRTIRELSLFTGAGGGILGTALLGWNHVGYVEKDEYCQKVIAQRIKDGFIEEAPIFGDVRTFIRDGYAASYQGLVDVVSAGFPCQPFSCAGRRLGENDERNMWPETIKCIRIIRPRFAFLENVPGLLAHGYIHTIFRDLAESGYDARWRVLSAAEVGAPHKRDRLWIVADSEGDGMEGERLSAQREIRMADVIRRREDVADAEFWRLQGGILERPRKTAIIPSKVCRDSRRNRANGRQDDKRWWDAEPDVGRVAHGVARRVDRLRALGNGQVPRVVAEVWRLLMEGK